MTYGATALSFQFMKSVEEKREEHSILVGCYDFDDNVLVVRREVKIPG